MLHKVVRNVQNVIYRYEICTTLAVVVQLADHMGFQFSNLQIQRLAFIWSRKKGILEKKHVNLNFFKNSLKKWWCIVCVLEIINILQLQELNQAKLWHKSNKIMLRLFWWVISVQASATFDFWGEKIFTSSQRSHRPGVSKGQIWGKMYFTYPLISLRSPLKNKIVHHHVVNYRGELVNTFYFVALMLMKNNSTREPKACISSTQNKSPTATKLHAKIKPAIFI